LDSRTPSELTRESNLSRLLAKAFGVLQAGVPRDSFA